VDTHLDPERDMVMADLLGTGDVRDWRIAQGKPSGSDAARIGQRWQTDGRVHVVNL
jgi:hypothetical protein